MDASVNTGSDGFQSVKAFTKQLVDAFDVSGAATRVAVISYDDNAAVNFDLSSSGLNNKIAVKNAIDRIPYRGGAKADASAALQLALEKIYTIQDGMRTGSNKVSKCDCMNGQGIFERKIVLWCVVLK